MSLIYFKKHLIRLKANKSIMLKSSKKLIIREFLMINYIKWGSTFLVLSGILLTNLNIYPLNIFIHGTGAIGWSLAGYLSSDKAILTNFGLQIPLFLIGYFNFLI